MAVIKTIDLVGVSTESWRRRRPAGAGRGREETIRGIEAMDILETSAKVTDGAISEYQTHVQIRFRIER
jgi:flavin-binding protein dodecin